MRILAIEGTRARPAFSFSSATIPSGKIERWPFQDLVIQAHYADGQWEILKNTFHFLEGKVSAKGTLSAAGNNLVITVDNASLAAMGRERGLRIPDGRLNVSCALKGPAGDWDASGSLWLTGMQWGQNAVGDARGDFDITPEQFQAQAKSDTSRFRFALDGIGSDKLLEVDRLELDLPSGASLTGEGHLSRATGKVHGSLEATHSVSFGSAFGFLSNRRRFTAWSMAKPKSAEP